MLAAHGGPRAGGPRQLRRAEPGMSHRLIGMLLLGASMVVGWLWLDYRAFLEAPLKVPSGGLAYDLEPGGGVWSLGRDLAARGVLRRPLYLRLLAYQRGDAGRLQAGEYLISPGVTPPRLLDLLISGRVIEHPITLVEGWTFAQVRLALGTAGWVRHTLDGVAPEQVMTLLGHPGIEPEGQFLPDTYCFPRGVTDLRILARAMQAMDRFLNGAWASRAPNLPLGTPKQALILASIVEKETGLASERPQIAGVFLRRLGLGMRLQSDPTVIYGLGEAFDGDLRRADLTHDTLYNTYVHGGLPPTPIALPGRDSIRAVLHPAAGDALYFVARGDGGHVFSADLAAHNRAVHELQLHGGRR
jgi:peptidoglycan lytic transglycosylase G